MEKLTDTLWIFMISKSSTGVTVYVNLYGDSLLIESQGCNAEFKLENPRVDINDYGRTHFESIAQTKRIVKKFIKINEIKNWEIRANLSDYYRTDDLELIAESK